MEIKQRRGTDTSAYQTARSKLPQPDGKHCILCGKDLPKRRRKYCSDKCYDDWYRKFPRFYWPDFRWAALERDKHTCVKCGNKSSDKDKDGWNHVMIVDHIKPIALGGEEFDMENCQTLCWECNKTKTKGDMKKIAELRRKIKEEKELNWQRRIHVPISKVI